MSTQPGPHPASGHLPPVAGAGKESPGASGNGGRSGDEATNDRAHRGPSGGRTATNGSDLAIRARGLTRKFGSVTAVDRVDLNVERAQVYGFLGPNGSGKSTTIRMLCGLLLPSAGDIEVLGYRIPEQAELLKRRIGYMTQKFSLYDDLSVVENLEFVAAVHELTRAQAKQRIAELIDLYWLGDLRRQLAGTLSGGQKQRLALAASVLHKPDLLLLDEPTSAVDPQSRREFWDSLFDLVDGGTTILVSTHYMDEAERCHRLAILDHGRLVANGSPQELMVKLPGTALLVESTDPRGAQRALADFPGIVATAQIGAQLRVLTEGDDDMTDRVARRLEESGVDAHVEKTLPNLEDVFVAATRRPPRNAAGVQDGSNA